MKVLIDTHVLLWSIADRDRIGPQASAAFRDQITEVVVSVASFWEIAIKRQLGRLSAPEDLPNLVSGLGHRILDIRADHGWHVRTLPRHHRDPFDRILVAQAQVEDLPIVTHDRLLEPYDVRIIWA